MTSESAQPKSDADEVTKEQGGTAATSTSAPPAPGGPGGAAPTTQGRKAPGTKDPIVYFWKVVGYSQGVPLTLVKCIEREEAEEHFARYQSEGYYKKLAIHANKERIPLPSHVSPIPVRPDSGKAKAPSRKKTKHKTGRTSTKRRSGAAPAAVVKIKASPDVPFKTAKTSKVKRKKSAKTAKLAKADAKKSSPKKAKKATSKSSKKAAVTKKSAKPKTASKKTVKKAAKKAVKKSAKTATKKKTAKKASKKKTKTTKTKSKKR